MFAEAASQLTREVNVFYMLSIYITRQALKLVFRLNEAADEDLPSDDHYSEMVRLLELVQVTMAVPRKSH
jgi:hypothetical protein